MIFPLYYSLNDQAISVREVHIASSAYRQYTIEFKTHKEYSLPNECIQEAKFQATGSFHRTEYFLFRKIRKRIKESVRDTEPSSTSRIAGPFFKRQMAYFGQCISTKGDSFVRSIPNHVLANSMRIC